jgi:hypothetical protein
MKHKHDRDNEYVRNFLGGQLELETTTTERKKKIKKKKKNQNQNQNQNQEINVGTLQDRQLHPLRTAIP